MIESKMITEYENIYSKHIKKYMELAHLSKKDFALSVQLDNSFDFSILMKMYIGDITGVKGISALIWDRVKEIVKKSIKK